MRYNDDTWRCPGCGALTIEPDRHVDDCDLVDGAGQPVFPWAVLDDADDSVVDRYSTDDEAYDALEGYGDGFHVDRVDHR